MVVRQYRVWPGTWTMNNPAMPNPGAKTLSPVRSPDSGQAQLCNASVTNEHAMCSIPT